MAEVHENSSDSINRIGETSGLVWRYLNQNEPTSISRLAKSIDAPRDLVLQAVGWLAREGKLEITETKRGKLVSLVASERMSLAG